MEKLLRFIQLCVMGIYSRNGCYEKWVGIINTNKAITNVRYTWFM